MRAQRRLERVWQGRCCGRKRSWYERLGPVTDHPVAGPNAVVTGRLESPHALHRNSRGGLQLVLVGEAVSVSRTRFHGVPASGVNKEVIPNAVATFARKEPEFTLTGLASQELQHLSRLTAVVPLGFGHAAVLCLQPPERLRAASAPPPARGYRGPKCIVWSRIRCTDESQVQSAVMTATLLGKNRWEKSVSVSHAGRGTLNP